MGIREARTTAHQAARGGKLSDVIDRRNTVVSGERHQPVALGIEERIVLNDPRSDPYCEIRLELPDITGIYDEEPPTGRLGRRFHVLSVEVSRRILRIEWAPSTVSKAAVAPLQCDVWCSPAVTTWKWLDGSFVPILFSNSGSGCQALQRSSLPGPLFSPR
jgi:hypothetical protein